MTTEPHAYLKGPISNWIDIATTGSFKQGALTAEMFDRMASGYDRSIEKAKVTLDHENSGPAFGQVHSFRREGKKFQFRVYEQSMDPQLLQDICIGRWDDISIEVDEHHAVTKDYYCPRVTVLGARRPACKGLDPIVFEESKDRQTVWYSMAGRLTEVTEPEETMTTNKLVEPQGATRSYSEQEVADLVKAKIEESQKENLQLREKVTTYEEQMTDQTAQTAQLAETVNAMKLQLDGERNLRMRQEVNAKLATYAKKITPAAMKYARPLLYDLMSDDDTIKFSEKEGEEVDVSKADLFFKFVDSLRDSNLFNEVIVAPTEEVSAGDEYHKKIQEKVALGEMKPNEALAQYQSATRADNMATLKAGVAAMQARGRGE